MRALQEGTMNLLSYFKRDKGQGRGASPRPAATLNDLLNQACVGDISDEEFVIALRGHDIYPPWVEQHLRSAYADMDTGKISCLIYCIFQSSFRNSSDTRAVTNIFCEIMQDPRCYMLAEEIADTIGYCYLDKSALRAFVKLCTSPFWHGDDWPDLRKALESMYAMYQNKICTKEEIIAAFQEIVDSPNAGCGLRDTASGFIETVHQPLRGRRPPSPPPS
jgi:hypothetical protein